MSPTREHSGGGHPRADAADDAGDVSPHAGARAQPGDVLGVETGGERTHVGDTADDENRRRRVAERLGNYDDEPGWSER
jgi:hypothetical protein